jgi:DHA3 family tetracycline resistance protein-like MFS transporter
MNKLPAETVYYIRTAAWEFNSGLIFTSIWALYFSVMQLSLVEVSLIFIVVTVSNLVLEVPTGIIADVYSRRLSVIMGGVFIGLAYVLMGAFPIFVIALIGAFIEAIGDTCVSGALQAWITDEVGADKVGDVLLRGGQVAVPAHWTGVAGSIILAALFNYQVPIVLGGMLWFVLTLFLIVFMPETNFKRAMSTSRGFLVTHARDARATFANGVHLVRDSRLLTMLFAAQFLRSAFADSFYKFSRALVLQGFTLPVITLPLIGTLKDNLWFGLMEVLQGLFFLVGAEVVRRLFRLDKAGVSARVLLVFHIIMLAALFVFAFTGNFALAIAAWLIVNGFQDLSNPISDSWLNQNVSSDVRATVLSMSSQTGMLGAMGSSTALSAFGDHFGVRSALALSGVLLLPLLLIYGRSAKAKTIPDLAFQPGSQ